MMEAGTPNRILCAAIFLRHDFVNSLNKAFHSLIT